MFIRRLTTRATVLMMDCSRANVENATMSARRSHRGVTAGILSATTVQSQHRPTPTTQETAVKTSTIPTGTATTAMPPAGSGKDIGRSEATLPRQHRVLLRLLEAQARLLRKPHPVCLPPLHRGPPLLHRQRNLLRSLLKPPQALRDWNRGFSGRSTCCAFNDDRLHPYGTTSGIGRSSNMNALTSIFGHIV